MVDDWRREPFVEYLLSHPMGPGLLRHPSTNEIVPPPMLPIGLPVIGGKARPPGTVVGSRFRYWEEFARRFPLLREWKATTAFMAPPDDWHPLLQGVWQAVGIRPPTPKQFARGFVPHSKKVRRRKTYSPIYSIGDIKYLVAWAHGWPVLYWEIERAAAALTKLCRLPNFFIWAANIDLRPVPLAREGGTMFERMSLRSALEDNPLDMCGRDLNKATANMSVGMLKGLARKSDWTNRSSRLNYISGKPYTPRKRKYRPNKNTAWWRFNFARS